MQFLYGFHDNMQANILNANLSKYPKLSPTKNHHNSTLVQKFCENCNHHDKYNPPKSQNQKYLTTSKFFLSLCNHVQFNNWK